MFSGIIEELGRVKSINRGKTCLIEIEADAAIQGLCVGESVAVNGACLTAVRISALSVSFEVIPETLRLTNLGDLRVSDKVNLERSLKVGDRISGHFVTGHVDCSGVIRKKGFREGNHYFDIAVPNKYAPFLLPKGSVAVDGISLTVMGSKPGAFSVYIIGHTFKNTTLGFKGPSDKVNVEFDILAKRAASRHYVNF